MLEIVLEVGELNYPILDETFPVFDSNRLQPLDNMFATLDTYISSSGLVFWVVILHKVVIRKSFSDEWDKRFL